MAAEQGITDDELRAVLAELSTALAAVRDALVTTSERSTQSSTAQISVNAGGMGIAAAIAACAVMTTASILGFAWQMHDRARMQDEIRELREQLATQDAYRQQFAGRIGKLESPQK